MNSFEMSLLFALALGVALTFVYAKMTQRLFNKELGTWTIWMRLVTATAMVLAFYFSLTINLFDIRAGWWTHLSGYQRVLLQLSVFLMTWGIVDWFRQLGKPPEEIHITQ
jgi:hypothetical protein